MPAVLIIIITIFADQISKYAAFTTLKDSDPLVIINNFFQLSYVKNYGAAWGILQNQRFLFVVLTILVLLIIGAYARKNKSLTRMTRVSLALIAGGALGNLIDRIKMGYVIDFLDINFGSLYDFPVFNFADSFIVVGTFLMMYLIITNKYEKQE